MTGSTTPITTPTSPNNATSFASLLACQTDSDGETKVREDTICSISRPSDFASPLTPEQSGSPMQQTQSPSNDSSASDSLATPSSDPNHSHSFQTSITMAPHQPWLDEPAPNDPSKQLKPLSRLPPYPGNSTRVSLSSSPLPSWSDMTTAATLLSGYPARTEPSSIVKNPRAVNPPAYIPLMEQSMSVDVESDEQAVKSISNSTQYATSNSTTTNIIASQCTTANTTPSVIDTPIVETSPTPTSTSTTHDRHIEPMDAVDEHFRKALGCQTWNLLTTKS